MSELKPYRVWVGLTVLAESSADAQVVARQQLISSGDVDGIEEMKLEADGTMTPLDAEFSRKYMTEREQH
jgi:hypothetical protein